MTTKPAISRRGMVAALGVVATGLAGCTTTGMSGTGSAGPTDSSVSHPTAVTDPIKDATAASEGIEEHSPSVAERTLSQMTLEEKVAQLFFVTPEGLTGVGTATVAGTMTKDALARIPVGGIIYFGKNLQSNQQVRDLLSGTYAFAQAAGAGVPPVSGCGRGGWAACSTRCQLGPLRRNALSQHGRDWRHGRPRPGGLRGHHHWRLPQRYWVQRRLCTRCRRAHQSAEHSHWGAVV